MTTIGKIVLPFLVVALCMASLVARGLWARGLPGLPEAELSFAIVAEEFGSSNRAVMVASPSNMKAADVRSVGGKTVMSWRGCESFGDDFEVTATLAPQPDGSLAWTFSYANCECPLPIAEVRFPILVVPRKPNTAILYPASVGALTFPEWDKVRPGDCVASARPQTFHFIASLTEGGTGWYVDQRDEARFYTGKFEAKADIRKGTVSLEAVCEPPAASPRDWSMPFGGTVAALPGADWFAAAAHYREWARAQPWYRAARARDFGKMRGISMWFWNRGAAEYVISPAEWFQKAAGVPVALDWYWWHDIPYDTGFPNFWPPREGETAFRAAVKRCNDAGIFLQVYTNGMTWDADDPSWTEGGEEGVRIDRDGTFHSFAFNRFIPHRLAYMCGTASRYQDRMYPLYRTLASTGMPGIYMDMIGNASYNPCYSTKHAHAPGGGTHGIKGYRDFVARVRRENPGVLLCTEDATEPYLDVFDAGICLACNSERFGTDNDRRVSLPVSQAIYHGCEVLFGSFAMMHGIPAFDPKWPTDGKWKVEKDWKALFPDQFALELVRGVTWGMQPMVHNFRPGDETDPRFADDCRLMIDTARFYHANRDLLFDGDMCAPGKMECDFQKVDFLVRGTYAREGEYRTITRETVPAVLHSVWRSPNGDVAAVLVNWTRKERKYRLLAPDVSAEGSIPPRSWALVRPSALVTAVAPAKDFDPRDFGAKGDGIAMDTVAIQRTIDECSRLGGGRVVLSRGKFLSGMVSLKDGVDLHIDVGAVLLGSPDDADFPTNVTCTVLDPDKTARGRTTALVIADGCRNVALTGRGQIDCNGMAYVRLSNKRGLGYVNEGNAGDAKPLGDDEWVNWRYRRIPGKLGPPRMVLFAGCQDVLVEDVSVVNSAAGWGYWVTGCDRVVFERAKVLANPDLPNNDGIHINASRDVSVSNCRIVAGDDAIVVRCNNRPFRDGRNRVCERVTVSNCQLTSHANAIRIGWLNDGVVRNCIFSNLAVTDSACGIGIDLPPLAKGMTDYGCEASLYENLVFSSIVMDRVYSSPVRIDITGEEFTRMEAIRSITFSDIRARAYKFPDLRVAPGRELEDIVFRGCSFTRCVDGAFPGNWRQKGAAYWWNEGREKFRGIAGVSFEGCTFADEAAK